jgi:hypothetical protein
VREQKSFAIRTTLIVILLMIVSMLPVLAPAAGVPAMSWSATFETASQNQFNACCNQDAGTIVSVTNDLVHSGSYSGYYTYAGSGPGQSIRAYPSQDFQSSTRKYLVEVWVYVPSQVDGLPVRLTSWISFLSVWINKDGCCAVNPITVDSDTNLEMHLWLGLMPSGKQIVYQSGHVKWPFDKWFRIGLQVEIGSGKSKSMITLLQDGVAVVKWTGALPTVANGLGRIHAGLYAGGTQGTVAVCNDDITVRNL